MRAFLFILVTMLVGKIFPLLAAPNVQVVLDGELPLPHEAPPHPPIIRIVTPASIPLVPAKGVFRVTGPKSVPLLAPGTVQLKSPKPIPLVSPDEPRLLPSSNTPVDHHSAAVVTDPPEAFQYRVIDMPLNDFGVAMARKAGLNYIYNPAVRGKVNGLFKSDDPIYMLRAAAKANGYRLTIKDGVDAILQKAGRP